MRLRGKRRTTRNNPVKTKRGISDAYRLGPVPEVPTVLRRATVFDVFEIARFLQDECGPGPDRTPAALRDRIAQGAALWLVLRGAQVLAVGAITDAQAQVWATAPGADDHGARLQTHLEAELAKGSEEG